MGKVQQIRPTIRSRGWGKLNLPHHIVSLTSSLILLRSRVLLRAILAALYGSHASARFTTIPMYTVITCNITTPNHLALSAPSLVNPIYGMSMASTAQTEPHFQFTCADPISNGVLCYNVFLCHVDLQTASRDERWPIKTLLHHSSAHKYCVLSASVMCHLRLHACLNLQQAMLSE